MSDEILLSSVKARLEALDTDADNLELCLAAIEVELEETKRALVLAREEVRGDGERPRRIVSESPWAPVAHEHVAALEAELAEAKRAHEGVVRERRRVCARLGPVSRVPYEVLARIFVLADDRHNGYGVTPKTRGDLYWALHYPMRLAQVNRQFRQVAITTAALWTNIYIRMVPLHPRNTLYLSRSQGSLLDIRVSTLLADPPAGAMDELFRVLRPNQWRSLRMNVAVRHMRLFLRHIGPAANLKVLELNGLGYFERTSETLDLLDPFEGQSPLLSTLTLCNASSRWSAGMFSALTSLSLVFPGLYSRNVIRTHLDLLQHAPKLRALSIMDDDSTRIMDGGPAPPMVRLEVVESLTINVRNSDLLHFVLSSLRMPALLNVTLQRWHDGYGDYTQVITVLVQNPLVAVKRLSLVHIHAEDILTFVRAFPGVEDLDIDHAADIIPRWYYAMRHTSEVVFPNLRCLKLVYGLSSSRLIDTIGQFTQFLQLWSSKSKGPLTVLLPTCGPGVVDKETLAVMEGLADFETFTPDNEGDTGESDDGEDRYDPDDDDHYDFDDD